jgi:threonine aldolase
MPPAEAIDLRSDTVTKPSPQMRRAMAEAQVGDDVYREDPTVNELEAACASVLGKEASLFVPSGTMGNLVSVLSHCRRGDEIIVGDEAHVFYYEAGGVSALGGVQVRTIPNHGGLLDEQELTDALRGPDIHNPRTALLCLENTHNRGGGRAIGPARMKTLIAIVREIGAAVHLDGARLFNAAVALDVDPKELTAEVDSVTVCFSKGLGAPVGSAIAGSREFVERCRRNRQMVGGGMRQAGVLAAAALLALHEGPKRLRVDHENAAAFSSALKESEKFDTAPVETNIVLFAHRDAASRVRPEVLQAMWREAGVLVNYVGRNRFRAVTHRDVSRDQVLEAARRLAQTTL